MKKLKLSLKELRVDSFETTTNKTNIKGTVNGYISRTPCESVRECPDTDFSCITTPCQVCVPTEYQTCVSCVNTECGTCGTANYPCC